VPDLGKGLGRNAPHLTDDAWRHQLQRRTAFHPAAKMNSFGKSVSSKVGSNGWLLRAGLSRGAVQMPAQLRRGAAARAPAPQVDGQLAGQRHGDFLFERRAVF